MKSPIFITLLTLKKPSNLKCSYFTHWFNCLRLNIGLDPHLFGSNKWWLKNWFSWSRLDVTISTAFFSTIVLISTSKISVFFWDNLISFGSKFWNGTCTKFLLNFVLVQNVLIWWNLFPIFYEKILAFPWWDMGLMYWNKIQFLYCSVEIAVIQSHFVYLIFDHKNLICNLMIIICKHASTCFCWSWNFSHCLFAGVWFCPCWTILNAEDGI